MPGRSERNYYGLTQELGYNYYIRYFSESLEGIREE